MADAVAAHPELELVTQDLSIATFRYVPPAWRARIGDAGTEERLDAINRAILDRVQQEGELFVSNAVVRGRFVLRACIVNFRTTSADVDAVPSVIARVGRSVAGDVR